MGEYFYHWWNGTLPHYYEFLGLTIPQLNKVAKLLQYASGFLTVFEFVRFSDFMKHLGFMSYVAIFLRHFLRSILDLVPLMVRLLVGILLVISREISFREMFAKAFLQHFQGATDAGQSARSDVLVIAFRWLEWHPVSEKSIRLTAFIILMAASSVEILTS